jgi:Flp pilus assembly protein TadG
MKHRHTHSFHNERGASLVELALVLPMLLLLILGVLDLARGYRTYTVLVNGAQSGAQSLAVRPTDLNGARALVVAEAGRAGLAANQITITFLPAQSSYTAGDVVTVRVVHNYTLLFGAVTGIPDLPLDVRVTMRVLYG